jgi:voltage-gated potassium channel
MKNGRYIHIRKVLASALDDEKNTKIDRIVDWTIIILIVVSTIEIFLSTFPSINDKIGGILNFIDIFTTVIFTVEVTLRIWLAGDINPKYKGFKGRLKYCFSFYGLIDIVATYPLYLGFFLPIPYSVFKVLRIARLMRIFRYMTSFKLLKEAFMSKKVELAVSLQFLCIITLILSFMLFFVENKEQPEVYKNGWKAVVWAFNQYIKDPGGFGNLPPVSTVGKLIACAIGILKIAIFAVPAGLIGSGFLQAVTALKERERLKVLSEKLHLAFERKLERYTGFQIAPMYLSIAEIMARMKMTEADIIRAVDESDNFRMINLAATIPVDRCPQDKLAVEHFIINRPYGCCIDRGSKITIVSPSGIVDPVIGHFSYYLAKMGGFNYLSREVGETRPYKSYYMSQYDGGVPGFDEYMKDLERLAEAEGSWIITLLAASGANEPEYPSQIHLGYGNAKGDASLDSSSVLIRDKECAERLFADIEMTMDADFNIGTERQKYHSTVSPKLFLRQLPGANDINGLVIRLAWSCIAWDSRRMLMAKTLADVLNRNIQPDNIHSEDEELKVKGIGYNDYLN